jgi:hypothetical protein
MDTAVLSAASGLVGSVLGATSSIVATWLSQQGQSRAQARAQEAAKREVLYSEFVTEASKRLTDALGHEATGPEVIVTLYAAVGRMRLMSSREVIDSAERLVRLIIDTYSAPNLSFAELRESIRDSFTDPLCDFGEACRAELALLRGQQTSLHAVAGAHSEALPPPPPSGSKLSWLRFRPAGADTTERSDPGRPASNSSEPATIAR